MTMDAPVALVLLGSAIMVLNVYLYIGYAMHMRSGENWGAERQLFSIPVVLLVLFLLGYLVVGLWGRPDVVVAFILFGGSLFVLSMILFLRRVTSGIQEHEQIKSQLKIAEESSRAKSSFLSVMSHEMRTPLNAIIGTIKIMERQPDLTSQQRERLSTMSVSANHLLALIQDVLDMSRIEQGRLELVAEPFELQDMLSQINGMIEAQCLAKGLTYEHVLTGECAPRYQADETKLEQVLINILGNAVKFTDAPGTVTFVTEVLSRFEGRDTVRFTVTDTGIGIDEEYLPKLFSAFSQEDTAITSRYGGSGLGMAISKSIVDMMGGEIGVTSKKGEGSTFTVTVTLRACDDLPGTADAVHAASGAEAALAGSVDAPMLQAKEDGALHAATDVAVYATSGAEAPVSSSVDAPMLQAKEDGALHAATDVAVYATSSAEVAAQGTDAPVLPARDDTNYAAADVAMHASSSVGAAVEGTDVPVPPAEDDAARPAPDAACEEPGEAKASMQGTAVLGMADAGESALAEASRDTDERAVAAAAPTSLEGLHVLIVEDVDINADILADILDMEGISSEHARDGQEAVDRFVQSAPGTFQAILMDLRMPALDGWAAARTIRKLGRPDAAAIPIVAVTANAFEEDVQRSLQSGMNAHLSKPVDPDELFETLQRLCLG